MEIVSEAVERYIEAHTSDLHELFDELAHETRNTQQMYMMQIGRVEGHFIRMLIQLMGAKRVLEIGTFTGYSALCIAEGLPSDGCVITCDINPETTAIASRYWSRSPHGHKIELRLGPALETLQSLDGSFDIVFIDADKENYVNYWNAAMPKVRQGGLFIVDNVLWSGRVLNPRDELDIAVDNFNKHVRSDDRVEAVMLSIRDGITLARKK